MSRLSLAAALLVLLPTLANAKMPFIPCDATAAAASGLAHRRDLELPPYDPGVLDQAGKQSPELRETMERMAFDIYSHPTITAGEAAMLARQNCGWRNLSR